MNASPKRANGPMPISKATNLWWCYINLLIFKLIGQSVFELESATRNISDAHTPKMQGLHFRKQPRLVVSCYRVKFQTDRTKHP